VTIRISDDPPNAETPLADLGAGTVPNDRFYVRCNFPVPRLDVATWRLEVVGAVELPRSWSMTALRALRRVERTITMECAGNGRTLMTPTPPGTPWGLGAVGFAHFGGVRLADVLAASEPRASAVSLVFTGADTGPVEPDGSIAYEFDLDVATATSDGPMLAWIMGGQPLSPEHGFPLRLVVPGHYGMRSVKWLTRITATERPFDGHFPRRYRYRGEPGLADGTPVGPMRVRSLIAQPADGERLAPGQIAVRGIAWSGHGPVASVEVAAGGTWMPARLDRQADDAAPVRWALDWTPSVPGVYALAVRATDAAGNEQPGAPVWNEGGYGNNVVHRIGVTVA
jgi:DMSO/TMAO reductase YedYZ molybdopterin-dependent catalytic subunit